ncbi:hypothetical protein AZI86_09990 [Bdellovibrio bacteriovorus]|uniref:Uncharacterized protein n=1 Tax=Bdellovibrio bacteriovorus TaxID=959 RepID=A0A150WSH3_BDEBC|nr:hypothetical protein [Bdellovibrio bacteriovorus]KYG67318.1 hypothetical protein AZI86_09990 [Bdellovibrio bacteriovorus]
MDFLDQKGRLDKVRQGLKDADDLELPMSEEFFDRLHDKIMAEVEKTEIAPATPLIASRNLLRRHWRSWLYPAGGVTSLFLLLIFAMPQVSKITEGMQRAGLVSDGQERIAARAITTPEELVQTFISSQSDSDFLIDVASESFENLSIAQFNKIMGDKVH